MTIRPDMAAEEAWREYRKRGEAVEDFGSFKRRWDATQKRDFPMIEQFRDETALSITVKIAVVIIVMMIVSYAVA